MFQLFLRWRPLVFFFVFSSRILFAKELLIIDTDVGYDDVMAIMSLLNKPEIEIKAITICGTGLVHSKQGLENVRLLLSFFNKNIPTAYGRDYPFEGGHLFPEDWRKNVDLISNRIKDFVTEEVDLTCKYSAVELLAETLRMNPDKITVLALGPLTNLAELFNKYPTLFHKIEKLYIMGGAFNVPGNQIIIERSEAEWNFFADSKAAKIVLESGVPIYLVPLDVTNQVPLTIPFYEEIKKNKLKTISGRFFFSLLDEILPWKDEFYFWDVVAAEILVNPSLAVFENHTIDVLVNESPARGKTYFSEKGAPINLAVKVDHTKLFTSFLASFDRT